MRSERLPSAVLRTLTPFNRSISALAASVSLDTWLRGALLSSCTGRCGKGIIESLVGDGALAGGAAGGGRSLSVKLDWLAGSGASTSTRGGDCPDGLPAKLATIDPKQQSRNEPRIP